ncbi:cytochrome c oxidase subunit 3 family protein [Aliikangiella sp. IMCC44359]|uniref:cytochrome c oxidase subunit 3 family protein n=1 Tax=Aliikangiella sp. IMCC44359 TaxID=3459125 RepID=UPI00403AE61F
MPGDLAIWIFIYSELAVFGILFVLYTVIKTYYPTEFSEGHSHLNQIAGLINTVALITCSYFVVMGVDAIKRDKQTVGSKWLFASLLSASVYVVVKTIEYKQSIDAGYELTTNHFYTYYYLLTGFHFAHVLLGMVILVIIYWKTKTGSYLNKDYSGIESGASYWHMVDLVWVILFPLVYVIK